MHVRGCSRAAHLYFEFAIILKQYHGVFLHALAKINSDLRLNCQARKGSKSPTRAHLPALLVHLLSLLRQIGRELWIPCW